MKKTLAYNSYISLRSASYIINLCVSAKPMNLKPTPLFLASIGFVCYGIYKLFSVPPEYEYLEEKIWAIVIIGAGVLSLILYSIFRIAFKKNVGKQCVVELILVSAVLFILYKKNGSYQFCLPNNYKGWVVILYGVEDAPKLKRPFYSNKTYVQVPLNGVILTSSMPEKSYLHSTIILDSTLSNIVDQNKGLNRIGIHYKSNTLTCYSGTHYVAIWAVTNEAEAKWPNERESQIALEEKLNDVCRMIDK